ncbi:MAG: hypothetical protein V1827_01065 [Candidatus Micrarchaeota archaeon]
MVEATKSPPTAIPSGRISNPDYFKTRNRLLVEHVERLKAAEVPSQMPPAAKGSDPVLSAQGGRQTADGYFAARNRLLVRLIESRTGVPARGHDPAEGPVRILSTLRFTCATKDYGRFEMVYIDGRFRKHPKMVSGHEEPNADEITIFKVDIMEAAKTDVEVSRFLSGHPELRVLAEPAPKKD